MGKDIQNKKMADKLADFVKEQKTTPPKSGGAVSPAHSIIQHEHKKQLQIVRQSCLKVAAALVAVKAGSKNKTSEELVADSITIASQLEKYVYGTELD